MTEKDIGTIAVRAATIVHRELGPGPLENSLRGDAVLKGGITHCANGRDELIPPRRCVSARSFGFDEKGSIGTFAMQLENDSG